MWEWSFAPSDPYFEKTRYYLLVKFFLAHYASITRTLIALDRKKQLK